MSKLRFTKMEGLGNDYVYVDGFRERVADPAAVARRVSDRRFGIGSDGLILIQPPAAGTGADMRMEMYNADGSRSEMCGNGLRCVAKYVHDHGIARKSHLRAETDAGVKEIDLVVEGGVAVAARIDMGPPRLERGEIPMLGAPGRVVGERLRAADRDLVVTCVSMGNPHCVTYVEKATDDLVLGLGPKVEHHAMFPARVNVEFIEIISPTDNYLKVNKKLREYFKAGVKVVWQIVPEEQTVYVYTSPTKVTICEGDTVCSAAPVVTDFTIPAKDIFVK